MSTLFASGTVIPSTWLNAVGTICEDGTFGTLRSTYGQNLAFDLSAATTATSLLFVPAITLAANKQYNFATVNPTITHGNTSTFVGYASQITAATATNSITYNTYGSVTATTGAGSAVSSYNNVASSAPFTGTLITSSNNLVNGGGATSSTIVYNTFQGTCANGVVINGSGSDSLGVGFRILGNCEVTDAAYKWTQRTAGTNAGDFLSLIDGTGTSIFKVDKNGSPWFQKNAHRIYGDFSNATLSNRTAFQDKTTNNSTQIHVIPNGTATTGGFIAHNGSDPDNSGRMSFSITSTAATMNTTKSGTGTTPPLQLYANNIKGAEITVDGNLTTGSATTRAATNGFLYIPKYNDAGGAPTGVPTAITGFAPMMANESTGIVYCYVGGSWRALN